MSADRLAEIKARIEAKLAEWPDFFHNVRSPLSAAETLWIIEQVEALTAERDALAEGHFMADITLCDDERLIVPCVLLDSNPDHADTCGSVLTPGADYPCSCWQADLRAALAATGEGEHVAREVFTADGIPFVRCSCSTAKSPTSSRWLTEHVPNGGLAELQAVIKRQGEGAKA